MKLVIDGAGDTGQGLVLVLVLVIVLVTLGRGSSHASSPLISTAKCQHHNFAVIITIIFITIKTNITIRTNTFSITILTV